MADDEWTVLVWRRFWTMTDATLHPDWLFVYGDNLKRVGAKGQACIRDAPNAVGIVTKKAPSLSESAFLTDDDYAKILPVIRVDLEHIRSLMESGRYRKLVIPSECWGTGLAELNTRAPRIFAEVKRVHSEIIEGIFPPTLLRRLV
jgi:hypothetical protein